MSSGHRVEDYFAEVLEGKERAEFERHLATCKACKNELEELRQLAARLSTDLPQTLPNREPRREWVEQVKADVAGVRRYPVRRLAYAGIPAVAVVLALVLFLVFQPWRSPAEPERTLAQAYEATLASTFSGTIALLDQGNPVLTGTFAHAPGNKWAVTLNNEAGETIEEIQVGDTIWQRQGGGAWASLERGEPLFQLPYNMGAMARIGSLLEGVTTLSGLVATDKTSYSGQDQEYVVRLQRDTPSGVPAFPSAWLTEHPPAAKVLLSPNGNLQNLHLIMEAPAGAGPITVNLALEGFGAPVNIEPPSP